MFGASRQTGIACPSSIEKHPEPWTHVLAPWAACVLRASGPVGWGGLVGSGLQVQVGRGQTSEVPILQVHNPDGQRGPRSPPDPHCAAPAYRHALPWERSPAPSLCPRPGSGRAF